MAFTWKTSAFSASELYEDHFIGISGNIDSHTHTHTRATLFKTDLWSSGQVDCSIWVCIITSQCLSQLAWSQEVFLPVFWLCCSGAFIGSQWDSAGEHTTSYGLRLGADALGLKPLHLHISCPLNTNRAPKPTTRNPQPKELP